MAKKKPRIITTAVLVDPMGSQFGEITAEMEVEEHLQHYGELLAPAKLKPYRIHSMYESEIKPSTELVLFDFGGMMMGNDLMEDNSRRLVEWASSHPSALVIVVSQFTYQNAVKGEMEELGLGDLHNIICPHWSVDDPIPTWFRKEEPTKALVSRSDVPTLPNIKFFRPTVKFLDWASDRYHRLRLYDVGAGVGHVSRQLRDYSVDAFPIDFVPREKPEVAIFLGDGCFYPYKPGSVVMLARPCHGVFAEGVIRQAIECRVEEIIYVGLEKNRLADLGKHSRKFKKQLVDAGEEKECVWVMTVKETK